MEQAPEQQSRPRMHRVFVSSTQRDLVAHRQAVHDVLERMGQFAVDMAQFGAQGQGDAVEVSTTKVAEADFYIGIVAWRYGYIPAGETCSVTHLEYLEAQKRKKPCFLFLSKPETEKQTGPRALFPAAMRDPDSLDQLHAFRANLEGTHVVDYFTTAEDLAMKVAAALGDYLLRQQAGASFDLAAAEAQYRQQVVAEYRTLRFSGFEQSDLFLDEVPLEQIFVRLRLSVEQVRREPEKPEEEHGRARGRDVRRQERVVTVQESITLAQALKKPLLLIGEPGAGKSTLLRWLAVTYAQGTQRQQERVGPEASADLLPALIELGRLPEEYLQGDGGKVPNWKILIPTLLTEQQRFAETPPLLVQQTLADGRCLLLFDGLDEVANRQARIRLARSLAELPRLFPGASIVIGSRPAGLSESESVLRPMFQPCEIQRFTSRDLLLFFRFWYALDRTLTPEQQEEAATALFTKIQATPGTFTMATTPLLATILLMIWRSEGTLPERRADLYARCCRVLVESWEHGKDVRALGALAHLDWEQHLHLLAPIAYTIHQQEQRTTLSRQELLPLLEQSLLGNELFTDARTAAQQARSYLRELGLRSGLLQYLGNDQFGFPHLTFQEYLAACHIAAQPDPAHLDLVLEHLHEAWWQEVHLLTVGVLGSGTKEGAKKASDLLLTILYSYHPPNRLLRVSRFGEVRLLGPGRWLPGIQLSRRIAWMLRREEQFALWAVAECATAGVLPQVWKEVGERASQSVQAMLQDDARQYDLEDWLFASGRRLGQPEREKLLMILPKAAVVEDLRRFLTSRHFNPARTIRQVETAEGLDEAKRIKYGDGFDTTIQRLIPAGKGQAEIVEGLLEALWALRWEVRLAVVRDLGQIGVGQTRVVEELLEALCDARQEVREAAAVVLRQIGTGQAEVVEGLLEALRDARWSIRWAATQSLGQIGTGQAEVVEGLLEALRDPHVYVREVAAESLGNLGTGQAEVVKGLLKALRDADKYVRLAALRALGKAGAVEALLKALRYVDEDVRLTAAESLRKMEFSDARQLHRTLISLNQRLYVMDDNERMAIFRTIVQLVKGSQLPGARLMSVQRRRARKKHLKQVAFWLLVVMVLMGLGLAGTLLTGALDTNSLLLRFLGVVGVLVGVAAAVFQILGKPLHDPWDRNNKAK